MDPQDPPRFDPPRPALTPRAQAEKQARESREAAALRANLQRRKQQARARAEPPPQEPPPDGA